VVRKEVAVDEQYLQQILDQAAPQGVSYVHNWRGPEDGPPGDLWHTGGPGGPITEAACWELAAMAPDLAREVIRLRREIRAVSLELDRMHTKSLQGGA